MAAGTSAPPPKPAGRTDARKARPTRLQRTGTASRGAAPSSRRRGGNTRTAKSQGNGPQHRQSPPPPVWRRRGSEPGALDQKGRLRVHTAAASATPASHRPESRLKGKVPQPQPRRRPTTPGGSPRRSSAQRCAAHPRGSSA
jgi:hypothetical protein